MNFITPLSLRCLKFSSPRRGSLPLGFSYVFQEGFWSPVRKNNRSVPSGAPRKESVRRVPWICDGEGNPRTANIYQVFLVLSQTRNTHESGLRTPPSPLQSPPPPPGEGHHTGDRVLEEMKQKTVRVFERGKSVPPKFEQDWENVQTLAEE